ncbi:MAG: hypothetical protein V9F00_16440 [Nocardioides sp.]
MGVLVLITGTGRSGTSTMSGTLHYLGLSVPGPHLKENESNPKGFFENLWSVKFHNALNERAGVNLFDSRPNAWDLVQGAITPRDRTRLRKFLDGHRADQVVIKDPRSAFTQRLWREAAQEVGLEIRYICMLRHPAEVVGSRTTYYASKDPRRAHLYQITNVARWVNASLISERETRGFPRAFVNYVDLLEDWRTPVAALGQDLGLTFTGDLTPGGTHLVDSFIEPSLRRHQPTWEDMSIPGDLSELAEDIWGQLQKLSQAHGHDEAAEAEMDLLTTRYHELLQDFSAVVRDVITEARTSGGAAVRKEWAAADAARTGDQRQLDEVGGRELVSVALGRLVRRLPGRKSATGSADG